MRHAEELRTLLDLLQPIDDIHLRETDCVAPHTTSARSRACGMVGFVIPWPEGSNPEGKGLDAGPTARLLASAEAGRHGVERSGSLARDAKQGWPDIDARLVRRRGVGASCRDHEEVRSWRSNALHSAPSRLTESPMNTT